MTTIDNDEDCNDPDNTPLVEESKSMTDMELSDALSKALKDGVNVWHLIHVYKQRHCKKKGKR